jgi:hypothetical protein
MSTTTKSKVPSTPDKAPASSIRYADDLYGWVEQQVALLKAGHLTDIDAENVAEELSDVGRNQYDKLESALRVLMLHLLKWDHQPTHRSRSWVRSIDVQRERATRVLDENPSLKPRVPEAIKKAYDDARKEAAFETGLGRKLFPIDCPYDWSAITIRVVEFDDQRSPDED